MANDEHVALLKQRIAAWNMWRAEKESVRPDLSGAKLERANLYGANLSVADLSDADLSGANLRRADLSRADLSRAELDIANLSRADLTGANLSEARLSRTNLSGANLVGADLRRADLSHTDLSGADLIKADLNSANLSGAKLGRANLTLANLILADLNGADLLGADLSGANLGQADLTVANLVEARLSAADLRGANLSHANLSHANLSGVNLIDANLSGTVLSYAVFLETFFTNVDLTNVIGLDTSMHYAPSSIDVRTLKKSPNLPLVFLRGVGLPDRLIDYLPSLLNQPIQFYSCFISYSSKDQDFAERIHADLQNKGVRCWFAPHDMRIGAKIIDAIDEAIRLRDKVLLILSEGAIASDWVEGEGTRALDEERTRKQVVLFPLRLDDAVMQTTEGWARLLRGQRHIGDFTGWKEHDSYQKGFDRLMRDLRVENSGQ